MSEAEALFSRLLALCNDVGLLAEEYDFSTFARGPGQPLVESLLIGVCGTDHNDSVLRPGCGPLSSPDASLA